MRSIRSRLTASLCLAIGALLIVTGLFIFFAVKKVLGDQFDETLAAKGQAIITAAEIDGGKLEIELALDDFAGFGEGGDYFEIRRENGRVEMGSPSLVEPLDGDSPEIGAIEIPDGFTPTILSGTMADGRRARFFVQRFQPRGGNKKRAKFSDLHLVVASPTAALDRSIAGIGAVLGIAVTGMLLVTVPLVRTALVRGLRPLGELSARIQEIGPERLDRRLDEFSMPAELVPVAAGLNAWLERLEESFQRERRFSSHAAHELRTPLAELKALAESGARWSEEATPERCGEMLEVVNELESLLDKLALLARADAGHQPLQPVGIDLGAAAETATARFLAKAAERGIAIVQRTEPGTIVSDPDLFATILNNLLGNAVAYAPAGSTIQLDISPKRLAVINPATDLQAQDLPHLFERFWRKDASRTGYGHSGLGLSIVKACAHLLGGTCHASFPQPGMLEVAITWNTNSPAEPAPVHREPREVAYRQPSRPATAIGGS
jgi:signal transduction histidine kinase